MKNKLFEELKWRIEYHNTTNTEKSLAMVHDSIMHLRITIYDMFYFNLISKNMYEELIKILDSVKMIYNEYDDFNLPKM